MNMPLERKIQIESGFYNFINDDVLPLSYVNQTQFWIDVEELIQELAPQNRALLTTRDQMQDQINVWHTENLGKKLEQSHYQDFLKKIGYLKEAGDDFTIETSRVDNEIATTAGPQLVVPAKNARFALNAANARWGSLYDALYGSDVIPQSNGLKPGAKRNEARAKHVINYAKDFLDETFPLAQSSHHDVASYLVYFQNLLAFFPDGSSVGLKDPAQFVALSGHKSEPTTLVLKNHDLHVEIHIDRRGPNGATDLAGIDDIVVEGALTTIVDFEDSVAAVDATDKVEVYRNWLGLMQGDLQASFEKGGSQVIRQMNRDRKYTAKNGDDYRLHGRALLLARNVGHHMETDLIRDEAGNRTPEGIIDAVVTALIGALDLTQPGEIRNSRTGSIYIVKPKMHGPDEVAFTCELFSRIETMLGLEKNTLKLGIMDEERRTTVNLKECIRVARERVAFINTGFLDRTGDEIHTSMQAGPFLPKEQIKQQPWIGAYENWNVDTGLKCGLPGKAQIGKGMWAMPDEMNQMMTSKIGHPESGANTAWVPSPTAATLHALHYHKVDVFAQQEILKLRDPAKLEDILAIPLLEDRANLSETDIKKELENNIQGILGYVVRWVEQGVGCSKVPDINNVGLMEDRATLRISSQHIANWLLHDICSESQILKIMQHMAKVVDKQNEKTAGYLGMTPNTDTSIAFKAARELIFSGTAQANGYTEPLLHANRLLAKNRSRCA